MSLLHLNFESRFLKGNTQVSVVLPDLPGVTPGLEQYAVTPRQFYCGGRRYKVLWLLHGTNGDHTDYLRKTNIERYAAQREIMVVMPSGLNADYMNWPGFGPGFYMEDYMVEELLPLVQGWLPASPRQEDNFIAGLSMGGQGALSLALYHTGCFAAAASMSYPPLHLQSLEQCGCYPLFRQRYENQVAAMGGWEGFLASHYNLWDRIRCLAEQKALPPLYFTIGTEDFFYQDYLAFKSCVQELGWPVVFSETPGFGHQWDFWDSALPQVLDFFGL